MTIENYSFHDSIILSVTENTQDHYLDFMLDFPTNWEKNVFERKILRFTEVIFYSVYEMPFLGPPTILNIINFGKLNKRFGAETNGFDSIRSRTEIKTNAGNRIIEYDNCSFLT
jgi:hypothetical protein